LSVDLTDEEEKKDHVDDKSSDLSHDHDHHHEDNTSKVMLKEEE